MEDDFEVDENAGVDEEIVKASWAGKKRELDAMEAIGIFDICEEVPKHAKVITTRWEKTFRKATSGDACCWTCLQSNMDTRSCASMQRMRTSTLRKTRKCTVGRRNGYHARGGRVEKPLEVEETAVRETECYEVQRVCRGG